LMERTAAHPPHDDAYRFSCLFYSVLYTPGRNRREIYSCWHWWDAPLSPFQTQCVERKQLNRVDAIKYIARSIRQKKYEDS
jgi:nitric oxide synthase oxygenase domain/subunit